MDMPARDCLDYMNRCGEIRPTVGGTVPWVWVLDCSRAGAVSELVGTRALTLSVLSTAVVPLLNSYLNLPTTRDDDWNCEVK